MQPKAIYLFVYTAIQHRHKGTVRLPVIKPKPIIQVKEAEEKNIQRKFLLTAIGQRLTLQKEQKHTFGQPTEMIIKKWPCRKMNRCTWIAALRSKLVILIR